MDRIVLGASLFRAAWAYRDDRAWLEDQLAFLQRHSFSAIRALGVVGDPQRPDYWDGREIDWRWPDYDAVIAGLTDLAFDRYGIRVQWTIFADADVSIPDPDDRARLVERFIRMSRGRERKILAFEVANEYANNGFGGADGIAQLGRLAGRLNDATPIMVAVSAHDDDLCALYQPQAIDLATFHFGRGREAGPWQPLVEPWHLTAERLRRELTRCVTLPPVVSNNEPVGPGSSMGSEADPVRLVAGAAISYVSGLPIYVFHSGPGVRDDPSHPSGLRPSRLQELPRAPALFGGFQALMRYLPPDVHMWIPRPVGDAAHPFDPAGGELENTFVATNGRRFILVAAGLHGRVTLAARRSMAIDVLHPLTGAIEQHRSLDRDARLELDGVEAFVIRGTYK